MKMKQDLQCSMKNGSSPRRDGLSIEFTTVFSLNRAKNITRNSFNESFIKGEMSFTQKQGIIILLHKGNDLPRNELTNWRPITLTNTNYKIMESVSQKIKCCDRKID